MTQPGGELSWDIDWKECSDQTVDDAEILCGLGLIGVRIPKCALSNISVRKAYLGFVEGTEPEEACSGYDQGDWRVYDVNSGSNCSSQVSSNGTHLIYEGNVGVSHGQEHGVISRRRGIEVEFVCEILQEITVSLDRSISTLTTDVQIDLGTDESSFDLHLGLYGPNFTEPLLADTQIFVPDRLNLRLSTEDIADDDSFKLSVHECWATPRYTNGPFNFHF